MPQHLYCLLPFFLSNSSSTVGLPVWPAQLPWSSSWWKPVLSFWCRTCPHNVGRSFLSSLFLGHCWSQFPNIKQPSAGSCNVSSVQHLSQADIYSAHCIWRRSAAAFAGQTSQHREWLCPCSSLPPAGGPHGETEPCELFHVFIWK